MCELGLRAGGAAGAKRLVGRKELKRGLKALSAIPSADHADGHEERVATPGSCRRVGWSEQEVDELLDGLLLLCNEEAGGVVDSGVGAGGNEASSNIAELSDHDFRHKLMLSVVIGGGKVDRKMTAGKAVRPLFERLEVRIWHGKDNVHAVLYLHVRAESRARSKL